MSFIDDIKEKIEKKVAPLKEFFDRDVNDLSEYGDMIDSHIDTVEEFRKEIELMDQNGGRTVRIDPSLEEIVPDNLEQKEE